MASEGAIVSIRRRTCCMAGVSPIRSGAPSAFLSRVSRAAVLLDRSLRSPMRCSKTSSSAHLHGLVR